MIVSLHELALVFQLATPSPLTTSFDCPYGAAPTLSVGALRVTSWLFPAAITRYPLRRGAFTIDVCLLYNKNCALILHAPDIKTTGHPLEAELRWKLGERFECHRIKANVLCSFRVTDALLISVPEPQKNERPL